MRSVVDASVAVKLLVDEPDCTAGRKPPTTMCRRKRRTTNRKPDTMILCCELYARYLSDQQWAASIRQFT